MVTRGSYNDYFERLAQRESGDRPEFVSSLGFLGKYQFAEPALQAIGYYAGDGTAQQDFRGVWLGRGGISSVSDFLNDEAAQDRAIREYQDVIWREITAFGDAVYAGQTLNGVRLTVSGMLAGAYLVGSDALNDFLESGGTNRPRDGFGTSIVEYIDTFADYATPARFSTGLGGDNLIEGGGANDTLQGRGGDDTLSGGPGFDQASYRGPSDQYSVRENTDGTLTITQTGGNRLDGSDRLISIEQARFADGVVNLAGFDPDSPGLAIEGTNERGSRGDDAITGTGGNDTLNGALGDDLVNGRGGNDLIVGAPGRDRLDGDDGNDRVLGKRDADTLGGGTGDDFVAGGLGDDRVRGGDGNDKLFGQPGDDTLDGGAGNDRLRGTAGDDALNGGAGRDALNAGDGDDTLNGGLGRDVLWGGPGNDVFVFENGFDFDKFVRFKTADDTVDLSRVDGVDALSDLVRGLSETGDLEVTVPGQGALRFNGLDADDFDAIDFIV